MTSRTTAPAPRVRGELRITPRITLAVAARVLTQLRRDHRTLAMLLVLPCLLISLLWWMFEGTRRSSTASGRRCWRCSRSSSCSW